ncbi:MAG: MG2 domain-containing protein [Bryobacteraceae bacterium]
MKRYAQVTWLSRLWLTLSAAALILASAALLESFQNTGNTNSESVAATYSRGILRVDIPYHGLGEGAGQLTVEILDPEDRLVARKQRQVTIGNAGGRWQAELTPEQPLTVDDLVWHRLRYRLVYAGEKDPMLEDTQSISQILRRPVVHVLAQNSYIAGAPAAVRVIVTDANNVAVTSGALRIETADANQPPGLLFRGSLNRRGTVEAQLQFPYGLTGTHSLHYLVDTPIGSMDVTQPVQIEDKASILLTTEKPIYQPSQTIHVRALALDRAHHEAAVNRPLTLEVEDPRGNKVFKKITRTDKFGIASAEFSLADEVNLGAYHLRALTGDTANPPNTAELAFNVERYVLPKFKVALDLAARDGQPKHGYRPGDHVAGTVRANYFFGQPVARAEITVKASGMDVAEFEAGSVQGKTDAVGAYRFDIKLPEYFAGRPLAGGAARVLIEATVKDSTGHSEQRGEPITVSESPLLITAAPEGGSLIPGLDNQVFLVTSYADGKPAPAELKVYFPGAPEQTVATDATGVGVVHLHPAAAAATLRIEATDNEGNHASRFVPLAAKPGADQILLRTDRAIYRAGDRIQLKIYSTKSQGTAYLDVVKDRQTVLTRDVDLANGQVELDLTATPELAGTIDCNAYLFGRNAIPVADHRMAFVEPADELKIETTLDAPVHKPGEDAHLQFHVTNARGEGVEAALGLEVVDEAVFALAEKQPGFAKVFFYLEQEAMKPRYEIHSIGMPDVVNTAHRPAEENNLAAQALFAATEMVNPNQFRTDVGQAPPMARYAAYATRYRTALEEKLRRESDNLARLYQASGGDLTKAELRDAWGTGLRISRAGPGETYLVQSAGADKSFNNGGDDLFTYLTVRSRKIVGQASSGPSSIVARIEPDRGPFNGRTEIGGTVTDRAGGAMEGVRIEIRDLATGQQRSAQSNADGQFQFPGVPEGNYEAKVIAPSETLSRQLSVKERDRAALSVVLSKEAPVTLVAVVNPPLQRIRVGGNMRQFDAGMLMNGAAVGVLGGIIGGVPMAAPPPAPPPQRATVGSLGSGRGGGFGPGEGGRTMAAQMAMAETVTVMAGAGVVTAAAPAPRVRSYFPEALYINPEIVTDGNGIASISIPLADSITTWRMAMMASTARGALGSGTAGIRVFQDFFVDLDLPVTLTQGDTVSIPVAVYNYSEAHGDVDLKLDSADWFSLSGDTAEKTLAVEAGRTGSSQFRIQANHIGKFKLTLAARMGARRADIVVREIEVVPNGREQSVVFNGRLENEIHHEVTFPATAIPDASAVLVRLYPGPLSQVIEGMDAILRMPYGCFEQTSSSTYPNVLALDYMKRTKKLAPEVHAKAEGFIANGYQRLLTFEVSGGGFSWFGQAPANKILTSYGLMEFYDMSQVHDVDPKLIQRTQQWLAAQQQPDGSWKPDTGFINEGATNRYNSDVLRITAYIAWSLENTGYRGPAVEKARQYIAAHTSARADTYTLAVVANFAADYGKDSDFTRQAMEQLVAARTEKGDQTWWTAEETGVYATGASATLETTGLATQALLKWGQASGTARKALAYIASKKDATGAWGSTQATIMALRAVLLSTEKGAADVRGTVELWLNGKVMERLALNADNNDLLHQFVFKGVNPRGANTVEVRFSGTGGLAYQVAGRDFVPWKEQPPHEPLSIDVSYDRTRLAQDDVATATATIKNNRGRSANMVMVDLGIPPGFDLLSEDLQSYQERSAALKSGRMEKFNMTATQAILYFDSFAPGDSIALPFRLRAKYPIRARTFASKVYAYYDPDMNAIAPPVELEVVKAGAAGK